MDTVQYTFSGKGNLAPCWVFSCLNLFRQQQVNIRKLVWLYGHPSHFDRENDLMPTDIAIHDSYLEIHFALPAGGTADYGALQNHKFLQGGLSDFLPQLETALSQTAWRHRQLTAM